MSTFIREVEVELRRSVLGDYAVIPFAVSHEKARVEQATVVRSDPLNDRGFAGNRLVLYVRDHGDAGKTEHEKRVVIVMRTSRFTELPQNAGQLICRVSEPGGSLGRASWFVFHERAVPAPTRHAEATSPQPRRSERPALPSPEPSRAGTPSARPVDAPSGASPRPADRQEDPFAPRA